MLENDINFYYNVYRIEVRDMNKKGFTLVELLVVIAIIALLSILVVPNIININKNINERLYGEKQDEVINSAQLYGTDYEEIFNGKQEVTVYVHDLIDKGYLTIDEGFGTNCVNDDTDTSVAGHENSAVGSTKGCVINPKDKTSMNGDYVILRKEAIGVVGEYVPATCQGDDCGGDNSVNTGARTLVEAVCDALNSGKIQGKDYNGNSCKCNSSATDLTPSGIQACIITGNDPDNYLKYSTMWRVVGLYKLDSGLSAKIITNGIVN